MAPSQPHQYKVAIAGNHDVLLDEEFLKKYPERRHGQTKTLYDLNWGTVQFLQHSSITQNFTFDDSATGEGSRTRPLTIYGSPWTPAYAISAFQYPSEQDIWTHRILAKLTLLSFTAHLGYI